MKRVRELIGEVQKRFPDENFFENFDSTCQLCTGKRAHYQSYESAFRALDNNSWETLKKKAINHFLDHREGQRKQGFFNQLNDAFAYRWLFGRSCTNVCILAEKGRTTPDLSFVLGKQTRFCEVKTFSLSDVEIRKRQSRQAFDGARYHTLPKTFFNKLENVLRTATQQLSAAADEGLVFLILQFDDLVLDHYKTYRRQIHQYCISNEVNNLYVKCGVRGRRKIDFTAGFNVSFRGRGRLSRL